MFFLPAPPRALGNVKSKSFDETGITFNGNKKKFKLQSTFAIMTLAVCVSQFPSLFHFTV